MAGALKSEQMDDGRVPMPYGGGGRPAVAHPTSPAMPSPLSLIHI